MQWMHVVIDVPPRLEAVSTAFWAQVLGWSPSAPWPADPAFRSFEPSDSPGDAYVHRQVGDHGPRIHLDVEVSDRAAETDRLRRLGASVGPAHAEWQVMESPGGLPFCLVDPADRTVPQPVTWDRHRSRIVQVCIDSPVGRHEVEVEFWRSATQGSWEPGDAEEFAGKLRPEEGPVQLLLQRLGPDSSATVTSAHIDLGTDDVDAEVKRVAALGAERIHPGRGWFTLRDPAGMEFCVTANRPA